MEHKTLSSQIRQANVSGQFYPQDSQTLTSDLGKYFNGATLEKDYSGQSIKIIVVPHAGYAYSGPTAAHAYKALYGHKVETVFLLGSSHTSSFAGVAVDNNTFWQTPLGNIAVDEKKINDLIFYSNNTIHTDRVVHESDHVLEVQLPFLQTIFNENFKIVPLVYGNEDHCEEVVARSLLHVMRPNDILIISTDLSHYPSYEDANQIDPKTLTLIANKDQSSLDFHLQKSEQHINHERTALCSYQAVKTGMIIAQKLALNGQVLCYQNSGHTQGNHKAVVGYGAIIFTEEIKEFIQLTIQDKEQLKKIVSETLNEYLINHQIKQFDISEENLQKSGGVFVTLSKNGKLRGCLGRVNSSKAIWESVRDVTIAASQEDQRFTPITIEELFEINYQISILSEPQKITDWRQIRLGLDGVIISLGKHSGLFLPQVATENNWNLEQFLEQLCLQKADLPRDCYQSDPNVEIYTFQTQTF